VSFNWRKEEFPEMNFGDGRQIGFIAQEVEEVLPEVVHTDSEGYKSVEYSKVVSVLVEAIKEQQKEIDELKQAKTELASLKAKMAQLEVAVQQLVTTQKNDGESLAGSEE
jgi:hypothetical protein